MLRPLDESAVPEALVPGAAGLAPDVPPVTGVIVEAE
jgi:hypothetical protein